MDASLFKRNELLAQTVIKGLESRGMSGAYAVNAQEAVERALEVIPEGSLVTMGGGVSPRAVGLVDALKAGSYEFLDREEADDKVAAMHAAFDADVYLASANAITHDGILVNIDGNGNRVAAIAYGPKRVVFVVGMNKVCADLDSALKRARNVAAPANAQRFDIGTPCRKKGSCLDCKSPDTICCQFLVTRFSRQPGRIHVILVNEELGF